ncbi:hypothetical protein [Mannheimia haemolytica]|uniref:hypothetical protein n=1 Tax=Mannheimia haemolytica TaxID=75985 RepID=UPI0038F7E3E3
MNKRIYVFADWETFSQPELVGVLSSDVVRGKENFRFSYDNEWLSSPYVQQIDPNLYLLPWRAIQYRYTKFSYLFRFLP